MMNGREIKVNNEALGRFRTKIFYKGELLRWLTISNELSDSAGRTYDLGTGKYCESWAFVGNGLTSNRPFSSDKPVAGREKNKKFWITKRLIALLLPPTLPICPYYQQRRFWYWIWRGFRWGPLVSNRSASPSCGCTYSRRLDRALPANMQLTLTFEWPQQPLGVCPKCFLGSCQEVLVLLKEIKPKQKQNKN